jgi:two-component system, sensor histidine kinase
MDAQSESARRKNLKFSCQIPDTMPAKFNGAADRLRQVLINLAGNAIKFTEYGEVAVRVTATHMSASSVSLRFEVADTGIGIASDQIKRIFEPFTQEKSFARRNYGGTGLGLSICKQLIEKMGGEIGVSSTLGKGSTFWFTLRMETPADGAGPEDLDTTRDQRPFSRALRGHVLLAEDNRVNQELALHILERLGCRVTVVRNGRESVEVQDQADFDLILMDCQMPEMDGYMATAEIRRREVARGDGRRIPIIAFTAAAVKGNRERCLTAGMDDYISKPFTIAQFENILRKWLPGTDAQQPRVSHLDRSILNGLRDLGSTGGTSLIKKIVSVYLDEAPKQLQVIESAIARGDVQAISRAAHALSSSSMDIGARSLSALCRHMENLSRENAMTGGSALLEEIKTEFAQVESELSARLNSDNFFEHEQRAGSRD